MPIVVTENWSGFKLSLVPPWEGEREFVVSGVASTAEALTAVDSVSGLAVPQRLVPHPASPSRLFCDGPKIKEVKSPLDFVVVTCHYSLDKGNFTDEGPDPLLLLPKITWTDGLLTVPVDHDLDNKAIINGAGDLYQGQTRDIPFKRLRVIKNMPFFDLGLSRDYEMAVNAAGVVLSGLYSIAPEHMLCRTIGPAIDNYAPNATFLPISFVWDVIGQNVLGKYPWQHRFVNAGKNGWYSDARTGKPALGRFVNPRGDVLDFDVRLDEGGGPLTKPYGSGVIFVGGRDGSTFSPISINTPAQPYKKEFYKGDGTPTTSGDANLEAVIFYYKKVRVVDMNPLFSLIG